MSNNLIPPSFRLRSGVFGKEDLFNEELRGGLRKPLVGTRDGMPFRGAVKMFSEAIVQWCIVK